MESLQLWRASWKMTRLLVRSVLCFVSASVPALYAFFLSENLVVFSFSLSLWVLFKTNIFNSDKFS